MSPERRPLASIAGGMRIEYGDLPVDYLFSCVRQHVSTRPCRCRTSSDRRRRRPRMRRIPSHCPIPTREAAGRRGSTNHEPVSCLFHCQSVSNRVTRTAGNRIPLSKARTGPRCRHKSSCLQSNRLGSCFQQRRSGWLARWSQTACPFSRAYSAASAVGMLMPIPCSKARNF